MTTTPATTATPTTATPTFTISPTAAREAREEMLIAAAASHVTIGYERPASVRETQLLQRLLSDLGYRVPVSGFFDADRPTDSTVQAIHEFQCDLGLDPTGVVNDDVRGWLIRFARNRSLGDVLWVRRLPNAAAIDDALAREPSPREVTLRRYAPFVDASQTLHDSFSRANQAGTATGWLFAITRATYAPFAFIENLFEATGNAQERFADIAFGRIPVAAGEPVLEFFERLGAFFMTLLCAFSRALISPLAIISYGVMEFLRHNNSNVLPDDSVAAQLRRAAAAHARLAARDSLEADLHRDTTAPTSAPDATAALTTAAPTTAALAPPTTRGVRTAA